MLSEVTGFLFNRYFTIMKQNLLKPEAELLRKKSAANAEAKEIFFAFGILILTVVAFIFMFIWIANHPHNVNEIQNQK